MRDTLTERITSALVRCKLDYLLEKQNSRHPFRFYLNNSDSPLYKIPYSRELSFFKSSTIKNLLFTLVDDRLWKRYQDVANHDSVTEAQCQLDILSDPISIPFNENAMIEKSFIIRMIYLLMGTNPYSAFTCIELENIYRAALFEVDKLTLSFNQRNILESRLQLKGVSDNDSIDPFYSQYNAHIELLKETKELLKTSFKIYSVSLGLGISAKRVISTPEYIHEDQLIQLWGGSRKAFTNLIAKNKKDNKKEIIKKEYKPRFTPEFHKKDFIEGRIITAKSAHRWLRSKRMITKLSENYDTKGKDCNYYQFSWIDKTEPNKLDPKSFLRQSSKVNRENLKSKKKELKRLKHELEEGNQEHIGPKVAVVGIGGAGQNIISNYEKNTNLIDKFIYIDSDNQSLSLSDKKVFTIPLDVNSSSRNSYKKLIPELQALLLDSDIVCFVAGLGGRTSDYACQLADIATRDIDCVKVFFVQLPLNMEGRPRLSLASTTLKRLRVSDSANVFEFHSQPLLEKTEKDILIRDFYDELDSNIYLAIESLASTLKLPGIVNIDLEDIKTIFDIKGEGVILRYKSLKDLEDIRCLDVLSKTKAMGILVSISGSSLTHEIIGSVQNVVDSIVCDDATLIYGIREDKSTELEIAVFLTGLDKFPSNFIKKMRMRIPTNVPVGNYIGSRRADSEQFMSNLNRINPAAIAFRKRKLGY